MVSRHESTRPVLAFRRARRSPRPTGVSGSTPPWRPRYEGSLGNDFMIHSRLPDRPIRVRIPPSNAGCPDTLTPDPLGASWLSWSVDRALPGRRPCPRGAARGDASANARIEQSDEDPWSGGPPHGRGLVSLSLTGAAILLSGGTASAVIVPTVPLATADAVQRAGRVDGHEHQHPDPAVPEPRPCAGNLGHRLPAGSVNRAGVQNIANGRGTGAKTDLTNAYNNAAGRPVDRPPARTLAA